MGFTAAQAGVSFGIYGAGAFAAKLARGLLADRYSIRALAVIGPLLWAGHFGRRHPGAIRGVMSAFYLAASIGGPMFAAVIYDYRGSCDAAFRVFAGYFLAGAALVWLAGRAPNRGASGL